MEVKRKRGVKTRLIIPIRPCSVAEHKCRLTQEVCPIETCRIATGRSVRPLLREKKQEVVKSPLAIPTGGQEGKVPHIHNPGTSFSFFNIISNCKNLYLFMHLYTYLSICLYLCHWYSERIKVSSSPHSSHSF